MKKTIAVIGSAAALTFAGAGLAAAEEAEGLNPGTETNQEQTPGENDGDGDDTDVPVDDVDTPAEVSAIAEQLCGTISAYDFLGSTEGIAPGLSGEECEANANDAVAAAMTGDIGGALDILRGVEAELPEGDDAVVDSGSAGLLDGFDSLSGAPEGDDAEV